MVAIRVEAAAATRKGSMSVCNEDAIGVGGWAIWGGGQGDRSPCWTSETMLAPGAAPVTFVVADGLGGLPGAQQGSLIVAECASRPGIGGPDALQAVLDEAHQRILELRAASMDLDVGATVAGVTVTPLGSIVCFNVGDSRVYFTKNDILVEASRDDAERLPFSTRASLTKWLGQPGEGIGRPWTRRLEPSGHHRLLVCTDGIYAAVDAETLQETVCDPAPRTASEIAERVMVAAGESSDDATLVIVQVTPVGDSEPATGGRRRGWWR